MESLIQKGLLTRRVSTDDRGKKWNCACRWNYEIGSAGRESETRSPSDLPR